MNESNYRSLCRGCDTILLAADASASRVAIPWLHVIREHPLFLVQYASESGESGSVGSILTSLRGIARNLIGWCVQLWRAYRTPGFGMRFSEDFPAQADVLIISHLINVGHLNRSTDFYFDTLPEVLDRSGYHTAVALINQTGQGYSGRDGGLLSRLPSARALLGRSMSLGREFANLIVMGREAIALWRLARSERDPFHRALALRAAREATSGEARAACRLGDQIEELVRRLQPRLIVTTYEGHAWERVAFERARLANPHIRCLAYQHAALFRLQHGLRRNLGKRYDPDAILTSGPAAKRQFERIEALAPAEMLVLGSNRAGSTRGPLDAANRERRKASPVCLVIPEGLELESCLLFEYSLHCAKLLKDVVFLWRMHPAASFSILAKKYPIFRTLPANVIMSESSLDDDAARASWALYRGTSAIVSAVLAGAAPVYLRVEGEMTIDPLYELNDARAIVSSIDDFVALVDGDKRELPTDAQADMAARYCMEVFSPMVPEVVVDYLDRIDRSASVTGS